MIKSAVKDNIEKSKLVEVINNSNGNSLNQNNAVKLDDESAFARKRRLKANEPVVCYTHRLEFPNRRQFRLHIKTQHSIDQVG
jgi:hypothetical protein